MKKLILLLAILAVACNMYAQTASELKAEAEQGDAAAMIKLFERYAEILDMENALFWLEKAAGTGDAAANYMYGLYLFENETPNVDCDKAISHITRAAESNLSAAQYLLGSVYAADADSLKEICPTVTRDLDKAEKWLLKCISTSEDEWDKSNAKKTLGDVYMERKNYAAALKLYREAAEQNNAQACKQLGDLYSNYLSGMRDSKEALKWYEKAKALGADVESDIVSAKKNIEVDNYFKEAEMRIKVREAEERAQRAEDRARRAESSQRELERTQQQQTQPEQKKQVWQQCYSCNGTGNIGCSTCAGTGKYRHSDGSYSRCNVCNGIGYRACHFCHGKGGTYKDDSL